MRKVALRGLFSRKLRLVLTSLAVALGVTLIAGTYVFTDTINASFDRIFEESNKGTDASITPNPTIDTSNNGGTAPTLSPAMLAKVRANPNVASADGSVFDSATILDAKGKKLSSAQAPAFVGSVADQPRFRGFTVKEGHLPAAPDEATIDRGTAKKKHLKLGDTIGISGDKRRENFTLVGFTQVASQRSKTLETALHYLALVEREAKRGEAMLMTRTRDFKTVLVPGDETMLGTYLTVELTGTTGSTCTGAIVRERQPLPMAG